MFFGKNLIFLNEILRGKTKYICANFDKNDNISTKYKFWLDLISVNKMEEWAEGINMAD